MADPLSQLRQFHINKKEIKEYNNYIIFGDHGWPKTVNTNYIIYSSGESGKKEYYTLECLLYFLKNVDVAHHHYVRQAGRDNVPVVHRPDRKNILAYLTGAQQTSSGIDKNVPISALRVPISEIYKKDRQSSAQSSANHSSTQHDTSGHADDASSKRPHETEVVRLREAFAARLDESTSKKPATITATDTKDNNEKTEGSAAITALGAEKLAAMRAKRMAVKRNTIVDADLDAGIPGASRTGTAPDAGAHEADLLIAMDSDPFKLIKSKEKVWRTRSTVLQAQSKNFAKSVLPLAQLISKPDDAAALKQQHAQVPPIPDDLQMFPTQQNQQQQQQQQMSRNAYNRYDQERFAKLELDYEIDTKKSFVSGVSRATLPQVATNNTPLNGTNQNLVRQNPSVPLPTVKAPTIDPRNTNQLQQIRQPSGGIKRPLKRSSCIPIIIIPATSTSIITMQNASAILQDFTYVDASSTKLRESEILIQRRKPDGTHAAYKVIDNPVKLDAEDWNRVVAVFVQGPAWQFKGWPWGGVPVEIFARIKAFHLKWDETRLDSNVAKWNVHILELSRSKRHLDKASLLKFWSSLDEFMVKFKSFLKF